MNLAWSDEAKDTVRTDIDHHDHSFCCGIYVRICLTMCTLEDLSVHKDWSWGPQKVFRGPNCSSRYSRGIQNDCACSGFIKGWLLRWTIIPALPHEHRTGQGLYWLTDWRQCAISVLQNVLLLQVLGVTSCLGPFESRLLPRWRALMQVALGFICTSSRVGNQKCSAACAFFWMLSDRIRHRNSSWQMTAAKTALSSCSDLPRCTNKGLGKSSNAGLVRQWVNGASGSEEHLLYFEIEHCQAIAENGKA